MNQLKRILDKNETMSKMIYFRNMTFNIKQRNPKQQGRHCNRLKVEESNHSKNQVIQHCNNSEQANYTRNYEPKVKEDQDQG